MRQGRRRGPINVRQTRLCAIRMHSLRSRPSCPSCPSPYPNRPSRPSSSRPSCPCPSRLNFPTTRRRKKGKTCLLQTPVLSGGHSLSAFAEAFSPGEACNLTHDQHMMPSKRGTHNYKQRARLPQRRPENRNDPVNFTEQQKMPAQKIIGQLMPFVSMCVNTQRSSNPKTRVIPLLKFCAPYEW